MNTNIQQVYIFFLFMLVGIIITILFDVFRILRRTFKTADYITYIEDVLFWIIAGSIILYTIFIFNNGEVRFYLFIAMLLGSILYIVTLSKYIIAISVKILNIVLAPFRKIFTKLSKFCKKFLGKFVPKKKKENKNPKFYIFLKKLTEKRRILQRKVEKNN